VTDSAQEHLIVVVGAVLLGLAIGSFLNVVAWRSPRGESVSHPASHCRYCESPIRARHNVPVVGWLLLRGRCYDCGDPISAQYPLIEALTGAAFGVLAWRVGSHGELAAYLLSLALIVVAVLWCLAGQDVAASVTGLAWLGGLALVAASGFARSAWGPPVRGVATAAIVLGLGLFLALRLTRGLRPGQAAFTGALGLYVGMRSWQAITVWAIGVLVLLVALLLARRRFAGRLRLRTPIGLGAVAAALIALLAG